MQMQQYAQQLESEIKVLEEQRIQAETLKNDLTKTGATLRGLKDPDNDQEAMIPIGSGVYIQGKITNWQKILVNVGAGTIVPKSLDEAIKLVDEQVTNYQKLVQEITTEIQRKVNEIQAIQARLQELQSGNWGVAPGNA